MVELKIACWNSFNRRRIVFILPAYKQFVTSLKFDL